MANKTLTIEEGKRFFIENAPVQFQVTDEKGAVIKRWCKGTPQNVAECLDTLDKNNVYRPGTYFVRTRTGSGKDSHAATFAIVKGNPGNVTTLEEKPSKKEAAAVEAIGTNELLNIISENKILRFKVETLEKTIEHLNHEIDALEEQIEEGHHEKGGMNEGILSALLPLGDRLLNIIETRTTPAALSAAAPPPAPAAPIAKPIQTVSLDTRVNRPPTAATPSPAPSAPPAAAGGGAAQDQPTDVEQIAALIIQRVEDDPDNPNALSQQMTALSQARPDIYEKVANLITAYYNQA